MSDLDPPALDPTAVEFSGVDPSEIARLPQNVGTTETDAPAPLNAEEMALRATDASNFLKALAHERRLMILCYLVSGEKSVTELETLLRSRQATVSQQLARLRQDGLVSARREGKAIYYSLLDPRAKRVVELVHDLFCAPQT